jgi:hypothetical protein
MISMRSELLVCTAGSDVGDHCRAIRDHLFKIQHPGIAGLRMVFVEPGIKTVAPENFHEPASRQRVDTGVAEKDAASRGAGSGSVPIVPSIKGAICEIRAGVRRPEDYTHDPWRQEPCLWPSSLVRYRLDSKDGRRRIFRRVLHCPERRRIQ